MKLTILFTLTLCGLLLGAGAPQTMNGIITDTMCGVKHGMMKGQSDAECARMCTKGSAEYALYDGKTVWKLSDQKSPAKFAAMKVNVTGIPNARNKTIKVISIEAAQ